MKLAIIGYGKMGKAIEAEALRRGHTIGAVIDNEEDWRQHLEELRQCDVAVEFSMPATAVANIRRCMDLPLPVVVGTTGWYDQLNILVNECRQKGVALFVASNFSIGMNIMFDLNRRLAQLMDPYPDYEVSVDETHHIHKLDAPSGTAITLANDIIDSLDRKSHWKLTADPFRHDIPPAAVAADTIAVTSHREGEHPGAHTVTYDSAVDTITLTHCAKSRQGLALGALLAAEFLKGKKGYYTMKELIHC